MSLLTFSPQSKARLQVAFSLTLLGGIAIAFSNTLLGASLFFLLVLTFGLIGWQEFCCLLKKKEIPLFTTFGFFAIAAFLLAFFLKAHEGLSPQLPYWVILASVAIGFILAMKGEREKAIVSLSTFFFGLAYVALPLAALIGINYASNGGRLALFFLLAVVKMNDVGGYIFGKRYGKHALASSLSPRKTWEGACGGFLLGIAIAFIFALFEIGVSFYSFTFQEVLLLSILLGLAAQFGDLAESCLKRDAAVKDSNTLVGLGGILDITDSLAFSAPLLYIYLS